MFIILYYLFTFTFSISSFSFFYYLYQQNYQLKEENEETKEEKEEEDCKPEIKYEDKYLSELKNLLEKVTVEKKSYAYLKNNFVMEKTPVGNVAMYYDEDSETFTYYTDNTIPYRFLEVIARKYVITFQCAALFIDMEKELKRMEEKKILLEEEKKSMPLPEKKSVFAKFKSYNKEGMSGRVNSAPPPKNSIPTTGSSKNGYFLMKDNANRYLCKGRFSNFPILQKVNRKNIDKEYAMTFSEYKKKLLENKLL
jgi:hypothetical protein